ncbi:MAG: phytoene desaturase family protein [Gammaproteobacteria bacterium]
MNCDFIVVGSGINSLVCALLLSKKGHRVLVLERNERLGGCMRSEQLTLPGFIHETLSCWYPLFVTSPAWQLLRTDLEGRGVTFCNTSTPTGVMLADGRHLIMRSSREANIAAMNTLCAGEGDRYAAAMVEFEKTLDLTFAVLGPGLRSYVTAQTFLKAWWRQGAGEMLEFAKQGLQSARAWLESTFESEVVRACLGTWTLHAGVGPDATSSAQMARLIPFTLEAVGAPVVKGGSDHLVQAFAQLIRANGSELVVNADVARVLVRNGEARGVADSTGHEYFASKGVICSVAPGQLYTRLLSNNQVPPRILNQVRQFRHGRAGMQIHLALAKPARWSIPEFGEVAVLHLTESLAAVSRAVMEAETGLLPASGTIVVGQPAVLDSSRVPEGKGLLWIQILDLPPVIKGDAAGKIAVPENGRWTDGVREAYADRIIERIARHVPGLKNNILARKVLSPADLERMNINLVGGDPYGGACSLDQSLFWRPLPGTRNHDTPIRSLYHIGASTHPGAGLGGGSGYHLAMKM